MAASYENDPDRRHFAIMLKTIREARGLSREEFGALCGYSASTVKSIETLQRPAYSYHARQFDQALGLDDMFQHEAKRFGKSGYSAVFGAFTDVEQEADHLYSFEHSTIHGLFQTEGYARAILATYPDATEEQVAERVTARLTRQAVLDREPRRLRVWALLDEVALYRRVGDVAVMYSQLMHLIEVSQRKNISLQVLPDLEGHAGLLGAFVIAERRGEPSMVHLEDAADGRVTDDPTIVEQTTLLFKSMQTGALSVRASQERIARVAEERWTASAPNGARALIAVPTAETV
jgi:transcriptional regulator with XRE-family HTH domain